MPVASFKVWKKNTFFGGQDFCFIICLKFFLGATKFGREIKIRGTLPPNAPVATGLTTYSH